VRLPLPARDHEWHWPVPAGRGEVVERLPADAVRRVGVAAGRALREATGPAGRGGPRSDRALRESLLDHVPITVESAAGRVEVRQRLVQALLRMDFMGTQNDEPVTVRRAGEWVGLCARYGDVWHRTTTSLSIRFVH
jgi:hypothetical protein